MTRTFKGAFTCRWAPSDGKDGTDGKDGNGIVSQQSLFATSDKLSITAYSQLSGWSTTFPEASDTAPYVWKSVKTVYTDGTTTYSTPEHVGTYSGGVGMNILENAAFVNADRMSAWTSQSAYRPQSGQTAPTDPSTYNGIDTTNKKNGHNSYKCTCTAKSTVIEYKEILVQPVALDNFAANSWYTLSFWVNFYRSTASDTEKRDLTVYLTGNIVDTTSPIYVDGVEVTGFKADMTTDFVLTSTVSSSIWKKHTITFKTKSSLSGTPDLYFRMWPYQSTYTSREIRICMPKLEVGMFATAFVDTAADLQGSEGVAGQVVRTSEWSDSKEYHNDTEASVGTRWLDVVVKKDSLGKQKGIYKCLKTHTSSSTTEPGTPGGSSCWQEMNQTFPIYTSLIMADNAVMQVAQSNSIVLVSADGSTIQGCLQGTTDTENGYMFWIGGATPSAANFKVKYDGTVKAQNFYSGVFIKGITSPLYYCRYSFTSDNTSRSYELGTYYTADEVSGDTGYNDYLIECTGSADIVILPITGTSSKRYVVLPRADDYEGKIVEVVDSSYASSSTVTLPQIEVSAANRSEASFVLGVYTSGVSNPQVKLTFAYSAGESGKRLRFISLKISNVFYWMLLEQTDGRTY